MSARNIIESFVNDTSIIEIIADGDLDGILASGLLSSHLKEQGIEVRVVFPPSRDLEGLIVSNAILIELPPSKGLVYSGKNILIDHHGTINGVALYNNDQIQNLANLDIEDCIASTIVSSIFNLRKNLSKKGQELLKSIVQIDMGTYDTQFTRNFHRAYQMNVT
ncbi:MAG: hypothetical protein GF411_18170, partial [Candidatus Lokiarchaeota archaeon]|nr:hypothetical protein [Candidatus Lokiarchaeota archaeon]